MRSISLVPLLGILFSTSLPAQVDKAPRKSSSPAVDRASVPPKAMPVHTKSQVTGDPSWAKPPKLVIGIVVDQMRPDYIQRYWENFGEGGFKRLIGEGAYLRNTHYSYVPTVTGPGHASIYTGSVPAHHGIVGNDMYDRASRKSYYCVSDPGVQGVGSPNAQSSPHRLLATTLADEIERRTDGRGRTIGVALKDRSSVLPVGRTGDAAYWYSSTGSFVTSTWYRKELPLWLNTFNAQQLPQRYLSGVWKPLLPAERYHLALPDSNAYEQEITKGSGVHFPYDLGALSRTAGPGLITTTPWGNTLTTDMALAALKGEELGTDDDTDLLAISYSSTDILGHRMGPRAMEMEDMYIRLDQDLARLLSELDNVVGAGRYTLFLTADHGAVDVPQYLKDLKGSAGYVVDLERSLENETHRVMDLVFGADGPKQMIDTVFEGQVFLSEKARDGAVAYHLVDVMRRREDIAMAFDARELLAGDATANGLRELRNGFMPQRSGDILYALRPGHFEAEGSFLGKGTTHGSGWNYDTHVPVILYGQGVRHTEVVRRTTVADIVPTVAMIVGCALPDAAVGEPVPEALH